MRDLEELLEGRRSYPHMVAVRCTDRIYSESVHLSGPPVVGQVLSPRLDR